MALMTHIARCERASWAAKSCLVLAAAFLAAAPARAEPDEQVVQEMLKANAGLTADDIRQNYNACDSGTTLSMKLCASYRLTEQDIRLNSIYKHALERAKKANYEATLVKAQRAWLAYRDAECAFEGKAGAGGGTAEGLYALSCKEALTKQQADRLDLAARN